LSLDFIALYSQHRGAGHAATRLQFLRVGQSEMLVAFKTTP